jgi:hypothetical protein
MQSLSPLALLAPAWLLFEIWQLVISERYLGVKVIQQNTDPRQTGPREVVAFFWSTGLILYWLWMVMMLYQGIGRAQVVALLAVSLLGFSARRGCALKWVLVILTLEGAVRIGMLVSLSILAWRRL